MIISCYLTPSANITDLQAKLDAREDAAQHTNHNFIKADDFNAKAI